MESLWHLLNLGSGWFSSVMRLTYQTLINMVRGRKREEREGRDEIRERREEEKGRVRKTGEREGREGRERQR